MKIQIDLRKNRPVLMTAFKILIAVMVCIFTAEIIDE